MTLRSELIEKLEVAVTDEVYDGYAGPMSDVQRSRMITRVAEAAAEVIEAELDARFEHSDHTAAKYWRGMREAVVERDRARAALAVFEAAHTPTDDEREALVSHARRENADRYAEDVRTLRGFAERERRAARAWEFFTRDDREMSHDFRGGYHQGMIDGSRLSEVPTDEDRAVAWAEYRKECEPNPAHFEREVVAFRAGWDARAGFHLSEVPSALIECPHWSPGRITLRKGCTACAARSEVPEPSGESVEGILDRATLDEYMRGDPDETYASLVVKANALASTVRRLLDQEPAQRLAAENAVRAEMARNGLDVHRMVHGWEIANVLAGAALDAALRAAGGAR